MWCIDAPDGQSVTLTFTDFTTEAGYDFVSIGDRAGVIQQKVSGTASPTPYTSASRLYVMFKTDGSVDKKGWSANWTTQ